MSSITTLPSDQLAPSPGGGVPSGEGIPNPWLAQVMLDTIARTGARIGVGWITVVGLCAILAPFLANSYPFLVKMNGRWSSPLARHLTPTDLTLLIGAIAAGVLLILKQIPLATRALILIAVVLSTLVTTLLLVHPPETNIYETYRDAKSAGRVQWMLSAPIPFSPGDHLRDQFDVNHPHPWGPLTPRHLFGTDTFGADLLSHIIHACRIAMAIGFIATGIEFVIGVVVGGLMGYFVGIVDLLGMRVVEIFSSIPTIYLLLTFVAVFERNIYLIMIIIGITGWTENARFVRAEFLRLRGQDFVQAAVAGGLPLQSILFRHLLPNALAPLLVSVSFGVASAILYESTLSFLGLGVPVGDPSWGQLLNQAVSAGGGFYWWLAIFPGIAIFLTVLAYNLVGEAFRDATDPRLRGTN
jgi:peptide/nickel transport system permease protein